MKKVVRTALALSVLAALSAVPAPRIASAQEPAQPAVAPAAAPAPAALPAAPPTPRTFFDGVQITFDGKAATPGAVGIDVQTPGNEAKVIWVRVLAKTTEGKIAEDVAKELTFALGSNFKVKTSGGRIRITKDNKKATPVSASIAGLSIYGVAVMVEQY